MTLSAFQKQLVYFVFWVAALFIDAILRQEYTWWANYATCAVFGVMLGKEVKQ